MIYALLFYIAGGFGPADEHRPRNLIETFSSRDACERDRPIDTRHVKFECADAEDAKRKMSQ